VTQIPAVTDQRNIRHEVARCFRGIDVRNLHPDVRVRVSPSTQRAPRVSAPAELSSPHLAALSSSASSCPKLSAGKERMQPNRSGSRATRHATRRPNPTCIFVRPQRTKVFHLSASHQKKFPLTVYAHANFTGRCILFFTRQIVFFTSHHVFETGNFPALHLYSASLSRSSPGRCLRSSAPPLALRNSP